MQFSAKCSSHIAFSIGNDFFSNKVSLNYFYSDNILTIPVLIIPRVPTQILETLCYWLTFLVLFIGYWRRSWNLYPGRLFGVFLVGTPIGIVMLYQSLSLVATQFSHANIKLPKKVVFCELPKTSTGKIQKFELRKKVKDLS